MQQHNDANISASETPEEAASEAVPANIFYEFGTLNETIRACHTVAPFYHGQSHLYKNKLKEHYLLYLHNIESSVEDFSKVCSILSEYADTVHDNGYFKFYAKEHCETIIEGNAVESLAII